MCIISFTNINKYEMKDVPHRLILYTRRRLCQANKTAGNYVIDVKNVLRQVETALRLLINKVYK